MLLKPIIAAVPSERLVDQEARQVKGHSAVQYALNIARRPRASWFWTAPSGPSRPFALVLRTALVAWQVPSRAIRIMIMHTAVAYSGGCIHSRELRYMRAGGVEFDRGIADRADRALHAISPAISASRCLAESDTSTIRCSSPCKIVRIHEDAEGATVLFYRGSCKLSNPLYV